MPDAPDDQLDPEAAFWAFACPFYGEENRIASKLIRAAIQCHKCGGQAVADWP